MSKRAFLTLVLSAMLLPVVSQAAIVNGDFESGLSAWTVTANPPASSVVITSDVSGNSSSLAHLSASADFTWTDDLYWEGQIVSADLASDFFTLGEGETTVSFQALAVRIGTGVEPAYVSFYGEDPESGASGDGRVAITSGAWNTYSLELRDSDGNFLPAGSMIKLFANVLANMPSYAGEAGQTVTMQSDLYVDNFVIPEPASLVLLLLGVAVSKRRCRA